MGTKRTGDIAEQRVVFELLKQGFDVLLPVGDRLPYDAVAVLGNKHFRIQVKAAWPVKGRPGTYCVDVRRHQTNKAKYQHTRYKRGDFDYMVVWVSNLDIFYMLPYGFTATFGGGIQLVPGVTRQRPCKSTQYKNAWKLLK